MKRILLVQACMVFSAICCAQWNWVKPLPQGNIINSSWFLSSTTAVAVSNCGTIIKTENSGSSWEIVFSGVTNDLTDVFFANTQIGYAVSLGGRIYKTINGGDSWAEVAYLGPGLDINSVWFTDEQTGYIVSGFGQAKKTTNGGVTWIPMTTGISTNLRSVCFTDANTGYIAGGSSILKTINAGSSWQILPDNTNQEILAIDFATPNILVATTYNDSLLRTTDAGTTWQKSKPGSLGPKTDVYFVNDTLGFVLAYDRIYKTTNSGQTWTVKNIPEGNCYTVIFFNTDTGFAFGQGGSIFKTVDSGNSWLNTNDGKTVFFFDIENADKNTFLIPTDEGKIYRTADAGLSWEVINTPTIYSLYSIYFISDQIGFSAGNNGAVLKTINCGLSWTSIMPTNSAYYLSSVFFLDEDTGWVAGRAGSYGLVLRTVDGGTTWSSWTTPNSGDELTSVFFTSSNVGYAVGYGGLSVYKTIDGGSTWTEYNDIGAGSFESVFFSSENTGYAAGWYGDVYKTTDAGATWVDVSPSTLYLLNSVYFENDSVGYAVGDAGVMIKTFNGGDSWSAMPNVTDDNLMGIIGVSEDTLYSAGNYGNVIRTYNGGGLFQPTVTGNPAQSVICVDGPASFSVTASGSPTMNYRWRKHNGTTYVNVANNDPPGAVYSNSATPTMTVSGINNPGTYNYICYIYNSYGSVFSSSAQLIVLPVEPAEVLITASENNICAGTQIVFSTMSVNCGTDPVFEWFVNDSSTNIFGGTVTFSDLSDNDTVSCVLYSNATCLPAYSNGIVIHVNNVYEQYNDVTICQGDSIVVDGNVYTATGTYHDTLGTQLGCDSIINTNLTVGFSGNNPQAICEGSSYLFNGHLYSVPGTYYDTLLSSTGCDSIVTTILNTNPVYSVNNYQSIFDGEAYDISGHSYFLPGTYYDTLLTQQGCDSIVTTVLEVHSYVYLDLDSVNGGSSDTLWVLAYSVVLDAGNGFTAYSWNTGDFSQTTNSYADGWYIVTATNSLKYTLTDSIYTKLITGINGQYGTDGLILYPNPNNGKFLIILSERSDKIRKIEIFNIAGVKEFEENNLVADRIIQITWEKPKPGVYCIRISGDNNIYNTKVVIR